MERNNEIVFFETKDNKLAIYNYAILIDGLNWNLKGSKNIVNEDLYKYLKNISNETLIIWGEKDIDTPLKDGLYLNKIIKNSSLIVYKNSSHFSYIDNSYLTNRILEKYLK